MAAKHPTPLKQLEYAFGFLPQESQHHFVVDIPRSSRKPVNISEHLTWNEQSGSSPVTTNENTLDGQLRVMLPRAKWDAIADAVRQEFNRRLKSEGRRGGQWRLGYNLLRRDFGKELVLLAWAIEEADPALIPNAIANWLGLFPEERWWLYTQTAAATGHALNGRNIGWRKAVRFALTENPTSNVARDRFDLPEFYARAEAQANEHQPRLLESSESNETERDD